jgi:hypothetical protein
MIVSSTIPPVCGCSRAESVDWWGGSACRSAGVIFSRKAVAPGPVK